MPSILRLGTFTSRSKERGSTHPTAVSQHPSKTGRKWPGGSRDEELIGSNYLEIGEDGKSDQSYVMSTMVGKEDEKWRMDAHVSWGWRGGGWGVWLWSFRDLRDNVDNAIRRLHHAASWTDLWFVLFSWKKIPTTHAPPFHHPLPPLPDIDFQQNTALKALPHDLSYIETSSPERQKSIPIKMGKSHFANYLYSLLGSCQAAEALTRYSFDELIPHKYFVCDRNHHYTNKQREKCSTRIWFESIIWIDKFFHWSSMRCQNSVPFAAKGNPASGTVYHPAISMRTWKLFSAKHLFG